MPSALKEDQAHANKNRTQTRRDRREEVNVMARGWESKSVEAQIEEGKEQKPSAPPLPAEVRATKQKLESLRLSRARILQQLERARVPAHREMLQSGLRAIEQQIEELGD